MNPAVYDGRACTLGEGPLWHPLRKQLFWFDILSKKLMTRDASGAQDWSFDEPVSAAGWIDSESLLIASATGLWRFDLASGDRDLIHPLEADNPVTRSNDGRADPWGGFWIGTMGYNAEVGAGAIYRLFKGELRTLFSTITISNSICFAPDRSHAYFSDTATQQVMAVALDEEGWPTDAPQVLIDLTDQGLNPDGATVDASGALWIALWGAARISVFDSTGAFLRSHDLPADHVTCPAVGGPDLNTLYVTSAREGLSQATIDANPKQGMTFELGVSVRGRPEPQVIL